MKLSRTTVTWLAVVLLIIAAGVGVWLWQVAQSNDEITRLKNQISTLEQNQLINSQNNPENLNTGVSSDDNSPDDTADNSAGTTNLPVVIFDPAGLFNDALKSSIQQKVIEPFTLYQKDQNQPVVAFHVQTSQVEGEYAVTAIMQDEVYSGFLIGGAAGIKWVPVCMDQCVFSNEFSAKYPNIVDEANP